MYLFLNLTLYHLEVVMSSGVCIAWRSTTSPSSCKHTYKAKCISLLTADLVGAIEVLKANLTSYSGLFF